MDNDAFVNTDNSLLLAGEKLDGAILLAACSHILIECMSIVSCKTSKDKVTGGYKLACGKLGK